MHGIYVRAVHLKGILNILADQLSRLPRDPSDWRLKPSLFQLIINQLPLTLDLFASPLNHCLERYCSRQATANSSGICLGNAWDHLELMQIPQELVWANPPFNMLLELLSRFCQLKQARLVLVFPTWPSAPW
jgi:hypothetical protein